MGYRRFVVSSAEVQSWTLHQITRYENRQTEQHDKSTRTSTLPQSPKVHSEHWFMGAQKGEAKVDDGKKQVHQPENSKVTQHGFKREQ